ncbi:MAG: lipocalin family protein [Bdellovibrionales bacterium]|nr:lipocalin family protein [Bdellovibrionales bacterium]
MKMKNMFIVFGVLFFSFLAWGESNRKDPLPTARSVDIARYMGKWYTVTSLPQFYTRNCQGQTAEYDVIDEKTIGVKNTCYKENGKNKIVVGRGTVEDSPNNARLSIRFNTFWTSLFRIKGEYVIIKLAEDYDNVMVGSTDRKALWIMSRVPNIDPTTFMEYKNLAHSLGYSVEQLKNAKY